MGTYFEVRYDKGVNAAYIALKKLGPGDVAKTYTCDIEKVGGMINLDFDHMGKLVGVEVLDATALLPLSFLFGED